VDGVPVLDSLSCWVKHAEMLVDLKRQSGVERCQTGYYNELPPAGRIKELLQFYGREPSGQA
jgi:allantoin racemase